MDNDWNISKEKMERKDSINAEMLKKRYDDSESLKKIARAYRKTFQHFDLTGEVLARRFKNYLSNYGVNGRVRPNLYLGSIANRMHKGEFGGLDSKNTNPIQLKLFDD